MIPLQALVTSPWLACPLRAAARPTLTSVCRWSTSPMALSPCRPPCPTCDVRVAARRIPTIHGVTLRAAHALVGRPLRLPQDSRRCCTVAPPEDVCWKSVNWVATSAQSRRLANSAYRWSPLAQLRTLAALRRGADLLAAPIHLALHATHRGPTMFMLPSAAPPRRPLPPPRDPLLRCPLEARCSAPRGLWLRRRRRRWATASPPRSVALGLPHSLTTSPAKQMRNTT